jgi:hypothetical protein
MRWWWTTRQNHRFKSNLTLDRNLLSNQIKKAGRRLRVT